MTDSIQQQDTQDTVNVEQDKFVSTSRAARIRSIVWNAAAQVLSEMREGNGTMIEKEDGKTPEGVDRTSNASKTQDFKRVTGKVFSTLGQRLAAQLDREYPKWREHYAGARNRVTTLNTRLADRYSDQYDTAKQQLDKATNWYETTRAKAEVAGTLPLEQRQEGLEEKASEAGTSVARKEKEIRQRIQEFLKKPRAKE